MTFGRRSDLRLDVAHASKAIIGVEWQKAMSELRTVDVQEIIARAGEALSRVSRGTVELDEVKVLSNDNRRNFIARATALYAGRRWPDATPLGFYPAFAAKPQ